MRKSIGVNSSLDLAVGTIQRRAIQRKTRLKSKQFEMALHRHQKRGGLRPLSVNLADRLQRTTARRRKRIPLVGRSPGVPAI
jgi:hypothetical protein